MAKSSLDSLDPLNQIKSQKEIKQRVEQDFDLPESKKQEYAIRAQKMKAVFSKFLGQMKTGCSKEICFNTYCKKNIFAKQNSFDNDQQLIRFALRTLSTCSDPDKLICSRTETLKSSNLRMQAKSNYEALKNVLSD